MLSGLLERSALYGVLAKIEALGLDLLEVRQLSRPSGARLVHDQEEEPP